MEKKALPVQKIPSKPGVYFFLGRNKEILYIGKATSLKQRVKSYFDGTIGEKRSVLIEKMVQEARTVEWTETDSVLEAMLLEVNLIRTHKPVYNTRSKDDKSYNHVVITKEEFPRVLVIRGKDLLGDENAPLYAHVYGPFPSGALFKEALKIIRKLFQFYDTRVPVDAQKNNMHKGKVDFNRQIGLYPGECSPQEYAKTIRHIQLFFEGKKQKIITELEKQMFAHAKREEFEAAHVLKKKIFALTHIQDIALLKDDTRVYKDDRRLRIEAYDVAHLGGKDMVGVVVVVDGGEPDKSGYRKFAIRGFEGSNDPRALREILDRRLAHREWPLPDLIVVDGSTAQKNAALFTLKKHDVLIPVVGVVKDEHHKPKRVIGAQKLIAEHKPAILLANAEAHRFAIAFHRKKRSNFMK